MSRTAPRPDRRFYRGVLWALLFAAPFWALVGFGVKAAAAPITDAPAFLAKRGLTANPVPLEVVPAASEELVDTPYGAPAQGAAYTDRVVIQDELAKQGGPFLAHVVLHEYLHQASVYRWSREDLGAGWGRSDEQDRLIEEGIVEAVSIDLLPAFYKYVTGKPIVRRKLGSVVLGWSVDQMVPPQYWPEVQTWRVLSARATGQPIRSKAAQEWRAAVLTWGPAERMAALA